MARFVEFTCYLSGEKFYINAELVAGVRPKFYSTRNGYEGTDIYLLNSQDCYCVKEDIDTVIERIGYRGKSNKETHPKTCRFEKFISDIIRKKDYYNIGAMFCTSTNCNVCPLYYECPKYAIDTERLTQLGKELCKEETNGNNN